MQDSDVNLYTYERLRQEFGSVCDASTFPARVEHELVGDPYRARLTEISKIVRYQWRKGVTQSSLKGFLFYGGVGVGKTTMAKRLAYEMCRVFDDHGADEPRDNEVVLVLIDGSDIARGRYGESEAQLRNLFDYARRGPTAGHTRNTHEHTHDQAQGPHGHGSDEAARPLRRTVLLFDDVESLLMSRSAAGAKEWHFSQNSVFFHNVDELDTAHTILVLTTNRKDLVDDAIVDRFLPYEFGVPPRDVLEQVARDKARLQLLDEDDLPPILARIAQQGVASIREVERLVTQAYVRKALDD